MGFDLDGYINIYNQIRFDKIEKLIDDQQSLLSFLNVPFSINNINELKNKIENIISSLYDENGEKLEQLYLIKEEMILRHLVENEDNLQKIEVLDFIFDYFKGYIAKQNINKCVLLRKIKPFSSIEWRNVLECVYVLNIQNKIYKNYYICENIRNIATSIKVLMRYKFNVVYKSSKFIQLPDKDIVREMENIISCLGGLYVANICLQQLKHFYNQDMDYIIIPQITSSYPVDREPRICWLYLLNLSVKHLNDLPKQLTDVKKGYCLKNCKTL